MSRTQTQPQAELIPAPEYIWTVMTEEKSQGKGAKFKRVRFVYLQCNGAVMFTTSGPTAETTLRAMARDMTSRNTPPTEHKKCFADLGESQRAAHSIKHAK